jgi:hypothetical protein
MDWNECQRKKVVKRVELDSPLIKSVLESSSDKYYSSKLIKPHKRTFSSIIILLYDSLRELLEAFALNKGYKIYNHECFSCFLDEIVNEREMAELFNRIRQIRNGLNYYGRRLSYDDFISIRKDIVFLLRDIDKLNKGIQNEK